MIGRSITVLRPLCADMLGRHLEIRTVLSLVDTLGISITVTVILSWGHAVEKFKWIVVEDDPDRGPRHQRIYF